MTLTLQEPTQLTPSGSWAASKLEVERITSSIKVESDAPLIIFQCTKADFSHQGALPSRKFETDHMAVWGKTVRSGRGEPGPVTSRCVVDP